MNRTRSLTVVIPALNEEANLEGAVRTALTTVPQHFDDWEIIIINDGSVDATDKIAERLALENSCIRVVHHKSPKNLGGCYKEGIRLASKEYLIMLPGDNECGKKMLQDILSLVGTADIIIPFTDNMEVRPIGRRLLSSTFVKLLNLLSGHTLRYYNGAVLHQTKLLRSISIATDSFGYQAEALVKLLRRGHSYRELPTYITYRPTGKSKALRLENILQTARFLASLAVQSQKY